MLQSLLTAIAQCEALRWPMPRCDRAARQESRRNGSTRSIRILIPQPVMRCGPGPSIITGGPPRPCYRRCLLLSRTPPFGNHLTSTNYAHLALQGTKLLGSQKILYDPRF
jgi:hypothetical protein